MHDHLLRPRIWPSFCPSGRLYEEQPCGSGFQPRSDGARQGDLLHKGVTPGRDRGIDSGEVGPALWRGGSQSPGSLPYLEENVVAPDALCFADDPASGAAPCCTAGSWAFSGLEPCESEPLWLPGGTTISTISLRRLVNNAGYGKRRE